MKKNHVLFPLFGLALVAVPGCSSESAISNDSIGSQRAALLSDAYVGLFKDGNWVLDSDKNRAQNGSDRTGSFGMADDLPFVVHRHPNLSTNSNAVGIFRNGTWCFDWNDSLSWDSGDTCPGNFGQAGDKPVVGRWFAQCTGADCIGVFRDVGGVGEWRLDTGNRAEESELDVVVNYGPGDALPVVGSWRTTAYTNIGYFRNGSWVLDTNGNMVEEAGDLHGSFGQDGDLPIAGDWDGDSIDNVGIFRPSTNTFCLDMNENATWDTGVDICFAYGSGTNNRPVVRGTASAPTVLRPKLQVIACKYKEDSRGDDSDLQQLRNELTFAGHGLGGLYDYVKSVTYGKVAFENNEVLGWYTINKNRSEAAGKDRWTRAAWCREAALASLDRAVFDQTPNHMYALTDEAEDSAMGTTDFVANWANWRTNESITFLSHELFHTYGLAHSKNNVGTEYEDVLDIMSGRAGKYDGRYFQATGPSLNAAYRYSMFHAFADDEGTVLNRSFSASGSQTERFDLVAVDHPEVAGILMVRLPVGSNGSFYSIEFREKSGWDRNIGHPGTPTLTGAVAIRFWDAATNSTTATANLHQMPFVPFWTQQDPTKPRLSVTLNSFSDTRHVADMTMSY